MIYVGRSVNVACMQTMGDRLRDARIKARFESAAKAAEALGVRASTYRAHENGQNEFSPDEAEHYARKFGSSAAFLLTGETSNGHQANIILSRDDRDEHIIRLWELFGEALKLETGAMEQIVHLLEGRLKALSRSAGQSRGESQSPSRAISTKQER